MCYRATCICMHVRFCKTRAPGTITETCLLPDPQASKGRQASGRTEARARPSARAASPHKMTLLCASTPHRPSSPETYDSWPMDLGRRDRRIPEVWEIICIAKHSMVDRLRRLCVDTSIFGR
jgi:hypothetical protein